MFTNLSRVCFVPLFAAAAFAATPPENAGLRFEPGILQVDASAVDARGAPVRDLQPEDLRVTQDGKAHKIASLNYVADSPRTFVFFINDANMPAPDIFRMREALNRFLDTSLKPDDRVALVTTAGGSSFPRQFAAGLAGWHRAVSDLHWRPAMPDNIVFARSVELLRRTVAALADLPGRKCIVVLTDDMMPGSFDVKALADSANRASVVIDVVDARAATHAAADTAPAEENFLTPLARATGGMSRTAGLELGDALTAVAQDQSGYYTVSWDPGPALHQLWGWAVYHRIEIKCSRPGVSVRTRNGFFGTTGPVPLFASSSRTQQIINAIYSPLAPQRLPVRLTPIAKTRGKDIYIQSLVHIQGGIELTPAPGQAGCFTAALTFYSSQRRLNDPEGEQPLTARGARLRLCGENARSVREHGLVSIFEEKSLAPGPYQMYVGVRNGNFEPDSLRPARPNTLIRRADWKEEIASLGSASDFIEVPAPGATVMPRLTLSGSRPREVNPETPPPALVFRTAGSGDPAVRVFQAGDVVFYPLTGAARARLLHDGEVLHNAEATGSLRLDSALKPGEYILEVTSSSDTNAPPQWSDFRIER